MDEKENATDFSKDVVPNTSESEKASSSQPTAGESTLTAQPADGSTASTSQPTDSASASQSPDKKQPVCVLVLGMAGSGKSSVTRRLSMHLAAKNVPFHTINLDPAVKNIPFTPLVDIRDTVNYKEVMKQYKLGPNGAIVTSLNLFSTMFEDVLKILSKREDQLKTVLFDTPGQIEVFCWSASGSIITGTLASVYPTVIVYVIDVVRSTSSITFMSNMMHACSILYKYKLPFIIAFNKVDIISSDFAFDWLRDYESLQDAVSQETSFSANLTSSLCLGIEEFYRNILACGVSAATGEGMDKLMELIGKAADEYEEYRTEYKEQVAKKKEQSTSKPIVTVRETIKKKTEVLIGANPDDSDPEDENIDEDDLEEKRELESFKAYIKEKRLIQAATAEKNSTS